MGKQREIEARRTIARALQKQRNHLKSTLLAQRWLSEPNLIKCRFIIENQNRVITVDMYPSIPLLK